MMTISPDASHAPASAVEEMRLVAFRDNPAGITVFGGPGGGGRTVVDTEEVRAAALRVADAASLLQRAAGTLTMLDGAIAAAANEARSRWAMENMYLTATHPFAATQPFPMDVDAAERRCNAEVDSVQAAVQRLSVHLERTQQSLHDVAARYESAEEEEQSRWEYSGLFVGGVQVLSWLLRFPVGEGAVVGTAATANIHRALFRSPGREGQAFQKEMRDLAPVLNDLWGVPESGTFTYNGETVQWGSLSEVERMQAWLLQQRLFRIGTYEQGRLRRFDEPEFWEGIDRTAVLAAIASLRLVSGPIGILTPGLDQVRARRPRERPPFGAPLIAGPRVEFPELRARKLAPGVPGVIGTFGGLLWPTFDSAIETLWVPAPVTNVVVPVGITRAEVAAPPGDISELIERTTQVKGNAPDPDAGAIEVLVTTLPDGTNTYTVLLPGTEEWVNNGGRQVSDLLGAGELSVGLVTAYETAVEQALVAAGAGAGDKVAMIGHSLGGMVAARLAEDPIFGRRYDMAGVVTAGSPTGNTDIPDGTRTIHYEADGDFITGTDGKENPTTATRMTVKGDMGSVLGDDSLIGPHTGTHYVAMAEEASAVNPSVARTEAEIMAEMGLTAQGAQVTSVVYQSVRPSTEQYEEMTRSPAPVFSGGGGGW